MIDRAKKLPGPGEYSPEKPKKNGASGRFSAAQVPGFVEVAEAHGEELPSAAEYHRRDQSIDMMLADRTQGRFSTAVPKNDVDLAILRYQHEPGPAQYDAELLPSSIGTGFRFSRGHAKSELEWVQVTVLASVKPSPGIRGHFSQQLLTAPCARVLQFNAKKLPGPGDAILPGPTHRHQLEMDQRADHIVELH